MYTLKSLMRLLLVLPNIWYLTKLYENFIQNFTCRDSILFPPPIIYWHRNWLKKLIVIKPNAAISFWILSCLLRSQWSRKISYNSNSWFRRDSKQRVSIISEHVLFIYLDLELSYVIRGFFQNLSSVNPPVSDDFHVRQGSLGYKFDEIVLATTPSQVNKNVQKRSVISMTPLGLQDTISWMFVHTSSNKSTFKVFYYKILKPN